MTFVQFVLETHISICIYLTFEKLNRIEKFTFSKKSACDIEDNQSKCW